VPPGCRGFSPEELWISCGGVVQTTRYGAFRWAASPVDGLVEVCKTLCPPGRPFGAGSGCQMRVVIGHGVDSRADGDRIIGVRLWRIPTERACLNIPPMRTKQRRENLAGPSLGNVSRGAMVTVQSFPSKA